MQVVKIKYLMSEPEYRLIKYFVKPEAGEYIPIEFIEMTREKLAWSPRMNQSVYVTDKMPETSGLKRVREVNVLKVINHLSGGIATIELDDEEKVQFENVYKEYLEKGGQILFSRKKVGRKIVSFFGLSEHEDRKKESVKGTLLSEKLNEE